MQIEPGTQTRAQRTVGVDDTALALGTGHVAVLATSRVIAWCEAASFAALEPTVPAGSTSVAMRVHIDHVRAASINSQVTAIATLERVEGQRFIFVVSVIDQAGEEIAQGRIVRVVVETASFMTRAGEVGRGRATEVVE